jgi:hypothetical protein
VPAGAQWPGGNIEKFSGRTSYNGIETVPRIVLLFAAFAGELFPAG